VRAQRRRNFGRPREQIVEEAAAQVENLLFNKPLSDGQNLFQRFNHIWSIHKATAFGQCHRQFSQREKPKHVSAPCPQNYKRRPRNWTPVGRIGEPRKSIRGKEMNITDPDLRRRGQGP
jgi:hypothetical protein